MKFEEAIKKTNIKYIASDLDGTLLLGGAQALSSRFFSILERLREKNILFILASGRQLFNEKNLIKNYCNEAAFIAENGGVIEYKGEEIYQKTMDKKIWMDVYHLVHDNYHYHTYLAGKNKGYVEKSDPYFINHLKNIVGYDILPIDNLDDVKEEIIKIAFTDFTLSFPLVPYLRERYGNLLKIVTAGNGYVDVINKECNKGSALKILLNKLNIDKNDGIAFGDAENDIELLETAGLSFAVGEPEECVRKASQYVIKDPLDVLELIYI